jgi:DamX protein
MPLERAALDELYAQTGGNIGVIHALAPQLLTPLPAAAPSPSLPTRMKALPILHIGAMAALLAVVIILVLSRGTATAPTAEAGKSVAGPPSAASDKRSVPLALPNSTPPAALISPAPVAAPVPPRSETVAPPQPARTVVPETVKHPQPKAVDPVAKRAPAKAATTLSPTSPSPASKPPVQPTQEPAPSSLAADARDVLGLPSQQFMLQLLGGESFEAVEKFKTAVGGDQRIYVCRTQSHGKPWFVALTGPYPTKIDAQAAALKLPELLRKQQPWPRSLASLQADIHASAAKQSPNSR